MALVELVAADADRALVHHAAQRDDGHFGGAPADVDHHGAAGVRNGQAGADGRGHGLFDQVDVGGAGAQRRLADGAPLDLGRAARHADDDARAGGQHIARVHHADELLEHLLGDGEVGDHAILHGADGFDIAGNAAQHLLGLVADGLDDFLAIGPAFVADGDDRGFIQHDALAADVDQRIGGTEVDRHIAGKVTAQESEHGSSARFRSGEACCGNADAASTDRRLARPQRLNRES
ncbi:Uncharacterised protein [Bordetella pertussis]|nr:Uncharacterised protein [Bordetella pertussis]